MQIGDTYEYKNVVTKEITAGALGSGGLDIFATPFLICWMEAAAYYYMKEQLPEGKSSVGTMVNVRHVSPSPIGAEITAKAELIATNEPTSSAATTGSAARLIRERLSYSGRPRQTVAGPSMKWTNCAPSK